MGNHFLCHPEHREGSVNRLQILHFVLNDRLYDNVIGVFYTVSFKGKVIAPAVL